MNYTIQQYANKLTASLEGLYSRREASSISALLLESHYGRTWRIQFDQRIDFSTLEKLEKQLARLLEGEPVQYIVGETFFFGLRFKLNRDVLIPRPETEELVARIIEETGEGAYAILDIGTGSGCIAVTIKHHCPQCEIYALDVSREALSICQTNADSIGASLHYLQMDIFQELSWKRIPEIQLIVSNPPYISTEEEDSLPQRVRAFEPRQALFVEHSDPLLFYRCIARLGRQKLMAPGWVFVEVSEFYAEQVRQVFKTAGYSRVDILHDMQQKQRFVRAKITG